MIQGWTALCGVAAAVGLLSIAYVYYGPFSGGIWRYVFRVQRGIDHIGPVLESVFVLLCVLSLFLISRVVFPAAVMDAALRDLFASAWYLGILAGFLGVALLFCLLIGPPAAAQEFKHRAPRLAGDPGYDKLHARLYEDPKKGQYEKEVCRLRLAYIGYVPFIVVVAFSLFTAFCLLAAGEKDNFRRLGGEEAKIGSFVFTAAGDFVPSTPPVREIDDRVIHQAYNLVVSYSNYQDLAVRISTQALGVVAILFPLMFWFLGTTFQNAFIRAAAQVQSIVAIVFLFVVTPVFLILLYTELVKTSQMVFQQFVSIMTPAVVSESGPERLKTLFDLREAFVERYSLRGYWIQLVSSWGGVLILFQLMLSFIRKRVVKSGIFTSLYERGGQAESFLKAIFVPAPREDAGKD